MPRGPGFDSRRLHRLSLLMLDRCRILGPNEGEGEITWTDGALLAAPVSCLPCRRPPPPSPSIRCWPPRSLRRRSRISRAHPGRAASCSRRAAHERRVAPGGVALRRHDQDEPLLTADTSSPRPAPLRPWSREQPCQHPGDHRGRLHVPRREEGRDLPRETLRGPRSSRLRGGLTPNDPARRRCRVRVGTGLLRLVLATATLMRACARNYCTNTGFDSRRLHLLRSPTWAGT